MTRRDVLDAATRNRILAALSAGTLQGLVPHLQLVSLRLKESVTEAGERTRYVLFPLDAVLSLVTATNGRGGVEIATVGNEGMVGLAAYLRTDWMPYRTFVQVPGSALRLDAEELPRAASTGGELDDVLKRHTQALLTQVAQSVACNRLHAVEERCARWLLATHDRVVGADRFPMTQEFLAQMLGVRRATVTVAAGILQKAGLIRYSRGRIAVVDRPGLEAASCDCYHVVRAEIDRLLPPPSHVPAGEGGAMAVSTAS